MNEAAKRAVRDFELYREVAKLVVPSRDPSKIAPRRLRGWAYWEIFDMIVTWHQSFMLAARMVAYWAKAIEEVIDLMMQYRDDQSRERPLAYPDDLSGLRRLPRKSMLR